MCSEGGKHACVYRRFRHYRLDRYYRGLGETPARAKRQQLKPLSGRGAKGAVRCLKQTIGACREHFTRNGSSPNTLHFTRHSTGHRGHRFGRHQCRTVLGKAQSLAGETPRCVRQYASGDRSVVRGIIRADRQWPEARWLERD